MTKRTVVAVDIGAESGRVIAVHFDGSRLQTEELHRFANVPVSANGTLYWDILRLWHAVQTGIGRAEKPASIGIDTWAIDFALLDKAGKLIGNPVHYRDRRTEGIMDEVFAKVSRPAVFDATGIQMLPFNTLYQLVSMVKSRDSAFYRADSLLTIPDLVYFWLTGVKVNEYTNATTTQCFNVGTGKWAYELLDKLDIPAHIFGEVAQPGQILGNYQGVPAVLSAHHDTGSAVVGVPVRSKKYAYLSSGTWSLLGLEIKQPIVNEAVLTANVTNEGGYGGTIRLLKNVMGLWILQEARRRWTAEGMEYSYESLMAMAQTSRPFVSLVNPDDPVFLPPGDMPGRIRALCKKTGQPVPDGIGAITRCILESLALKYRYVLRQLVALTDRTVEVIHVVGGGAQNGLLNQMTADATGCTVIAGPVEATAIGNALVQLMAIGELKSIDEARSLVAQSFKLGTYQPQNVEVWDDAEKRFTELVAS